MELQTSLEFPAIMAFGMKAGNCGKAGCAETPQEIVIIIERDGWA
jgi:hypothetical protein